MLSPELLTSRTALNRWRDEETVGLDVWGISLKSLRIFSTPFLVLCDEVATRIVSYGGPVLDPISGHFPSATRRWALNRQEKIKAERRATQSHGPDA